MRAWLLEILSPGTPPPRTFVQWCRGEDKKGTKIIDANRFAKQAAPAGKPWEGLFLKAVNDALRADEFVAVQINSPMRPDDHHIGDPQRKACMAGVGVSHNVNGLLTLENLSMERLDLGAPSRVQVNLKNSDIKALAVSQPSEHIVTIENCRVGTLTLTPHSIGHYEMRGGCILNIDSPPPGDKNPFTGSVSLLNVFLPRDTRHYLLRGPQPYRNLRAHLRSLENAQTANLVHAAEMAVERETDTKMNNFFSVLYELLSDFGSSALRPILWLTGLLILSSVVFYAFDGAHVARSDNLVGWRCVLLQSDQWGRAWRAVVMALQPITSPLSIFGARGLLVPNSISLAIWSVIQGVLSITFIALFLLAIRRRFKMQ